jgi:hypothetical protein
MRPNRQRSDIPRRPSQGSRNCTRVPRKAPPRSHHKDIDLLEAPGTQVAPGAARQVASLALDLSAKVRV